MIPTISGIYKLSIGFVYLTKSKISIQNYTVSTILLNSLNRLPGQTDRMIVITQQTGTNQV